MTGALPLASTGSAAGLGHPDVPVRGVDLDAQTRCAHWRTDRDVVALRLACCAPYWACRDCHDALADHPAVPVPERDFGAPHVLCGVCRAELDVHAYREAMDAPDPACPSCGAGFNPGCARHSHLYFEDAR